MDEWRDKDGFLLQSEFRQWMEGVVNKALNKLKIYDPESGRGTKYIVCVI